MYRKRAPWSRWLALYLILFGSGCMSLRLPEPSAPLPTAGNCDTLQPIHRADHLTLLGCEQDEQAIRDIAAALSAHQEAVCSALKCPGPFPVTVRVYPDQQSLDGARPEMKGYYAFSGGRSISMVSPRNPIPQMDLSYENRVLIAVHEFVHLVNNEINPDMPLWLNEGTAIHIGPHDVYTYVCTHQFPFDMMPSLQDLEESYANTPAADLFSYAAVDWIISRYGLNSLNALLRAPDSIEAILGLSQTAMDQQWWQFMKENYCQTN